MSTYIYLKKECPLCDNFDNSLIIVDVKDKYQVKCPLTKCNYVDNKLYNSLRDVFKIYKLRRQMFNEYNYIMIGAAKTDPPVGQCPICKENNVGLYNTSYVYKNINCDCCGKDHIENVTHCCICESTPPKYIRPYLEADIHLLNECKDCCYLRLEDNWICWKYPQNKEVAKGDIKKEDIKIPDWCNYVSWKIKYNKS